MFFILQKYRFESKFAKILFALIVSFNSINCFEREYPIGYYNHYRNSETGLGNKFSQTYRHPQRNHRIGSYYRPDYDDSDYMEPSEHEGRKNAIATNYANLFAVDEQEFKKRLEKMSTTCRLRIKPELGKCVEKSANKWNVNIQSDKLGPNDCKALWELMCCATALTHRLCHPEDITTLDQGFDSIAKQIEVKECLHTTRATVECPKSIDSNDSHQ